jgi:hypothetical protein
LLEIPADTSSEGTEEVQGTQKAGRWKIEVGRWKWERKHEKFILLG